MPSTKTTMKLMLAVACLTLSHRAHAKPEMKSTITVTKEALLAFLPRMTRMPNLPPTHPFMVRASKAADDLLAALAADDVPDKDTWAWRGWVWAYHESALTADALGDAGLSCGYLQVMTPSTILSGATCDKVRKDGVLGFRVGLGLMKRLIDKCGSVQSGLTSYATGKDCPTWTLPLVTKRMKLSGDVSR